MASKTSKLSDKYAQYLNNALSAQVGVSDELYNAESSARSEYADLETGIFQDTLADQMEWYNSVYGGQVSEAANVANAADKTAAVNDLATLGSSLQQAYLDSNPELAASRAQVAAMSGGLGSSTADSIYQTVADQTAAELTLGGSLSREEERRVAEDSRAAYSDRGMLRGNGSIVDEAMALSSARSARQAARQASALAAANALSGQESSNLSNALSAGTFQNSTALNTWDALQSVDSDSLNLGTTLTSLGADASESIYDLNDTALNLLSGELGLTASEKAASAQKSAGLLGALGSVLGAGVEGLFGLF